MQVLPIAPIASAFNDLSNYWLALNAIAERNVEYVSFDPCMLKRRRKKAKKEGAADLKEGADLPHVAAEHELAAVAAKEEGADLQVAAEHEHAAVAEKEEGADLQVAVEDTVSLHRAMKEEGMSVVKVFSAGGGVGDEPLQKAITYGSCISLHTKVHDTKDVRQATE